MNKGALVAIGTVIAVAAIVYITGKQKTESASEQIKQATQQAQPESSDLLNQTKSMMDSNVEQVQKTAAGMSGQLKTLSSQAQQKTGEGLKAAQETTSNFQQRVAEATDEASEKIEDAAEDAQEDLKGASQGMSATVQQMSGAAQTTTESVQATVTVPSDETRNATTPQ